jgi:hypothetical protein
MGSEDPQGVTRGGEDFDDIFEGYMKPLSLGQDSNKASSWNVYNKTVNEEKLQDSIAARVMSNA